MNLQDPLSRRSINRDDALCDLFYVDSINMFQMKKILAKHISGHSILIVRLLFFSVAYLQDMFFFVWKFMVILFHEHRFCFPNHRHTFMIVYR